MKLRAAQEKLDEVHAKFLELEDKYQESVEDIKTFKHMVDEHKEYEHLIRKNGQLTIPETHTKIAEVRARLKDYIKEYGKNSLQVSDLEDELLKLGSSYQTVLNRLPKLKGWVQSKSAPLDSASQSWLDGNLAGVHPPSAALTEDQTLAIMARGRGDSRCALGSRGCSSSAGRARSTSSRGTRGRGFGRGRGMAFLEFLRNRGASSSSGPSFVENYLSFSKRKPPGS